VDVAVFDWVAKHAQRYPHRKAVIDVDVQRTLTYGELDARACRLAAFLAGELGVVKGERIAILARNSVEFIVLEAACVKTGAIMVPLNWRLSADELSYQIGQSGPGVLLYGEDFAGRAQEVARRCSLAHLVDFRYDGGDSSLQRAIERSAAAFAPVRLVHADPWMIFYTSGTTGFPKGSVLTHGAGFFNTVNYMLMLHVSAATVTLNVLPLFHAGGISNVVNPVLHCGGTLLNSRQFDAGTVLGMISDPALGITHFCVVPTVLQAMSQHPDFERTDFSRLVSLVVGGAPVAAAVHRLWRERGVNFQEGYGLTECGPAVLTCDRQEPISRAGSAGKPMMHIEVRLVDAEGRDVAPGEAGELWVRGPTVTPGYWNNPEATRQAFRDGWFMTGDTARCDADGYYYIVGRVKDMYISGGENVYPAEIENVLHELPQIMEAAVIGVPDEKWGEVGCAAVVLRPDASLSAEAVIAHCRSRLGAFKVPKSVVFVDALPHNAMNKVLKQALRAQLGEQQLFGT